MNVFPRVAFVAGTLGRGGAERQLYYMLRAMVAAGAEPVVACLTEGEHWEDEIRALGVPVFWFGQSRNPAARVKRLVSVLAQARPDVVQSVYFHTNLYAVSAASALRVPAIGAIRSDTRWAIESLGRFGVPSLKAPRHLAVNSLHALQQANELGVAARRLTLLPNVVDTAYFRPGSSPAVSLLAVGRYVEVKRHDRFLRLVRAVHDARPQLDVHATIVGEGPLERELLALAARLDIADRVEFVTNPPMAEVYARSSLFVLTSTSEGTPNVVLEAMACGVPVVAFGVGGVPELIPTRDVGILVDPGDERRLVQETIALLDAPDDRAALGAAARRFISDRHSPEALPRYLRLLYRRSLTEPRARLHEPMAQPHGVAV